ncbi:unnamed protein product [Haemonchus placei]|uniref:Secreted protein n=1 Tax=Haemonchus placei TaxID=6290 RepID=A0A0N4WCL3_HAEPC|nr:unnamed protein product [Haemonchus placei]
MSSTMYGLLLAMLLMSCVLQAYAVPSGYLCKTKRRGERCFVMVNLLRTPHHSPNWSISSWNRAMIQQKAYQQLFQEPDVLRRRRAADELVRHRRHL